MAWDKTQIRREKAARMEAASVFTDAEIAAAIGLTPAGLAQMKMTPEYQDILLSVKTGILRDMDAGLGDDIAALRQRVRDALPIAVNTLIDAASQRRDVKLAANAAESLIAMDGRLAKVSRIGLPDREQGGVGIVEEDGVVATLLDALKTGAEKKTTETIQ